MSGASTVQFRSFLISLSVTKRTVLGLLLRMISRFIPWLLMFSSVWECFWFYCACIRCGHKCIHEVRGLCSVMSFCL
ncbi:hypothetical protein YC2023_122243 [Brassica napus]